MNNKQQFDREWGDRAAMEYYPQHKVVIEWWQDAMRNGDWAVCEFLLRGAVIHCPDSCFDDYALLARIAKSRIKAYSQSACFFLLKRCNNHNRRMMKALDNAESALLSLGYPGHAEECREAMNWEGGDHEL